jgi:hypothetical protein
MKSCSSLPVHHDRTRHASELPQYFQIRHLAYIPVDEVLSGGDCGVLSGDDSGHERGKS